MPLAHLPRRLARPAAACIAAAALAAFASGCGDAPPLQNTNSTSVSAPGTTAMKDTAASFDTTQYFPYGSKESAVLMVEAMGPKSIRVNRDAQYQMKVTNLTDATVKNVMIASTNPDGFQVTGAAGATTQPGDKGMLGYPVGDLGPKEAKTITMTGMGTKVGTVDTCYSVTFTPPTLCTMVQVTNPAVQLVVQAPADADICQPLTYTYTVTNTGTGTAHNVTVMEDLPAGLTTAADGKSQVMANLQDIPQGQSRQTTAQLKAAKRGEYDGQAMAKVDGGDGPQAVATKTMVHAPELAVAVTGPDQQYVNTDAKYTITVTNKGDATSANTKLMVQHSTTMGNLTMENVDPQGTVTLGDIAPNETKTVTATGQSAAGGAGTVVATASSPCAGEAKNQAMTTFNTIPALLLETVDEHDPVKVGGTVVYDVKVTNQGSGPDNHVAVKAIIPDGETYVSTDGVTQPTVDGQTLTFPVIDSLASKSSVTWKVSVTAAKAGDVQFKTIATCDGTAPAEKTEPTKLVAN